MATDSCPVVASSANPLERDSGDGQPLLATSSENNALGLRLLFPIINKSNDND